MSELIDREATVKQICKMGEMLGVSHDRDVTIAVALFVQDDKSAFPTVERPHGEWIDVTGRNDFVCSVCKHKAQIGCIEYCGNCGADMRKRGGANETN